MHKGKAVKLCRMYVIVGPSPHAIVTRWTQALMSDTQCQALAPLPVHLSRLLILLANGDNDTHLVWFL